MTTTDHERLAAARDKKRRKLERWFAQQDQTVLAARRLAAEHQFAAGTPLHPPPDLYPEDGPEVDTAAWPCAA